MNYLARYLFKLPKHPRRIARTCLYGLAAGAAAVLFQLSIQFIYQSTIVALARQSTAVFLVGTLVVLLGSTLAVGFLLNSFCAGASGSGVPQLKLAFWKDFGFIPWRVVWVKFLAGALSVGGGSSLGREGPSVHLSGGLASNMAGWLGEPKQNRRESAVAGAAAGLAAAFNTPIAAVTFVLEEILQDLNNRFLGGVLLASILGAFTVYAIQGKHPAFTMPEAASHTWVVYVLIPVVALFSSLAGMAFQKATLALRRRRKEFAKVPLWIRPCLGGTVTWILGASVFLSTGHLGVFSLGYDDLSQGLTGQLEWKVAGVLLGAKLIATIACYGFGGCGGIFAPCLFFGAMCGVSVGGLCEAVIPSLALAPGELAMLAVIGMSSCLGSVVRAPITSILIVFEMTHQFTMVPGLMLGTLVSQGVGIALARHNFYDTLLLQDGHNLEHVIPPRDLQSWQQLPVSAIANFQPVSIPDLALENIRAALKTYPYQHFPVMENQMVRGVLTRKEAQAALEEQRPARIEPPTWCLPRTTIRELQVLLIESSTGLILVRDKPGGSLIGLVTLHDLLRAEVTIAKTQAA